MKPSFAGILMGAAGAMASDIAPAIGEDAYAKEQAAIVGLLLVLVAQEADRAADTLSLESVAMRALFADAASHPLPDQLRRRLSRPPKRSASARRRLSRQNRKRFRRRRRRPRRRKRLAG